MKVTLYKPFIVFVSLIFLLLLGNKCKRAKTPDLKQVKRYGDFIIRIIDSCEYLQYESGLGDNRVYSITHKGNCKHCLKK